MHPVERYLFATDFKDLAGTRLQGTIALSDELINLGIMDFLQGLTAAAPANEKQAPPASKEPEDQRPDPLEMLRLLDIDRLEIKAKEGKIFLEVDVEIKG